MSPGILAIIFGTLLGEIVFPARVYILPHYVIIVTMNEEYLDTLVRRKGQKNVI